MTSNTLPDYAAGPGADMPAAALGYTPGVTEQQWLWRRSSQSSYAAVSCRLLLEDGLITVRAASGRRQHMGASCTAPAAMQHNAKTAAGVCQQHSSSSILGITPTSIASISALSQFQPSSSGEQGVVFSAARGSLPTPSNVYVGTALLSAVPRHIEVYMLGLLLNLKPSCGRKHTLTPIISTSNSCCCSVPC
jgi:hypothetical protein